MYEYVCVYSIGEVSKMNLFFNLLDSKNLLECCSPLLWVF